MEEPMIMNNLSPRTESSHSGRRPPPVFPKSVVVRNGRNVARGLLTGGKPPSPANPPDLEMEHQSTRLLRMLDGQRAQGFLCDATLFADGRRFRAHRAVLAASSGYFWELLSEGKPCDTGCADLNITADNDATEIVLDNVGSEELETLLRFMYTGSMDEELGVDGLRVTLDRARELQVAGAAHASVESLQRRLCQENCLQVYLLAAENALEGLRADAEGYIAKNLAGVTASDAFLGMGVDDLLALICSPSLKLKSRLGLQAAAQKWLDHDPGRAEHAQRVRDEAHANPMRIVLGEMTDRINVADSPRLGPSGDEDEIKSGGAERSAWVSRVQQSRLVVLVFGGEDKHGTPSQQVYQLHPQSGCCEPFHAMPTRRLDLAIAPLADRVVVAGGQYSSDSHASDSIDTVHCLDLKTSSWRQMSSMLKRRALFTLSTIDGRVYAVGGKNAQGSLASVECFDPRENTEWRSRSPLVIPTFGHATTVHDGKLYTCGGVVIGRHFTNSLQCYDPVADLWSYRCPMSTKRALHVMCAVGDKLYAIGGNTRNKRGKRIDCEVVERYDVESDQWVDVRPMPRAVCLAGVASMEHRIYVIGGYNGRLAVKHGDIQCYDTRTDRWSRIGQLPEALMRLSACLVSVPAVTDGSGRTSALPRNRSGSTGNSSSEASSEDI